MPDQEPERKPTNQEIHEARLLPPEPKPPRVKSLLEQLHEEWVRLAQTDSRLTGLISVRHEAQFTLNKADSAIRLRLKFLQKKAVEKIQKKNGVRVIPGFRLPGSATKEDLKEMRDQLARIAAYHGFELPEDFSPDRPQLAQPLDIESNEQPDPAPPQA